MLHNAQYSKDQSNILMVGLTEYEGNIFGQISGSIVKVWKA